MLGRQWFILLQATRQSHNARAQGVTLMISSIAVFGALCTAQRHVMRGWWGCRFLMLTGCRKGEALSPRWDWLNRLRFAHFPALSRWRVGDDVGVMYGNRYIVSDRIMQSYHIIVSTAARQANSYIR